MTTNRCLTCLSSNRLSFPLKELQSTLEYVNIFVQTNNHKEGYICWECKALIMKFSKFKRQTTRAQKLLHNNVLIVNTLSNLKMIKKKSHDYKFVYNNGYVQNLIGTRIKLEMEVKAEKIETVENACHFNKLKELVNKVDIPIKEESREHGSESDSEEDDFDSSTDYDELEINTNTCDKISSTSGITMCDKNVSITKTNKLNSDTYTIESFLISKANAKYSKPIETDIPIIMEETNIPILTEEINMPITTKRDNKIKGKGEQSNNDRIMITQEKNIKSRSNICEKEENSKTNKVLVIEEEDKKRKFKTMVYTEEEMLKSREGKRIKNTYKSLPFKCNSCVQGYKREVNFKDHVNKYHTESAGSHMCDICECRFTTQELLRSHRLEHYVYHKCIMCVFETPIKSAAQAHCRKHKMDVILIQGPHSYKVTTLKHSTKLEFICDICNKSLKTKSRLETHISKHDKNLAIDMTYCGKCNIQYKTLVSYRSHFRHSVNHNKKRYQCVHCNKSVGSEKYLNEHIAFYHLKQSNYKCLLCDKMFMSCSKLKLHNQTRHGAARARPFACDICGKKFFTGKLLRDHRQIHSALRPLMCAYCGDTFKQKPALYTHCRLVHKIRKLSK